MKPLEHQALPTLPQILHARSQQLRDQTFVRVAGKPDLSWKDFAAGVFGTALRLREAGLQRGDRVAILCENRVDWLRVHLAIFAAGLISVPLLPSYSDVMIERVLKHAEPRAMFVEGVHLARATELRNRGAAPELMFAVGEGDTRVRALDPRGPDVQPSVIEALLREQDGETVALISYTSGSTGDPKGVLKNHRITVVNHGPLDSTGQLVAARPEETAALLLSLNHGMGQGLLYRTLVRGNTLAMVERAEPEIALADVAAMQPTVLWVVPRVIKRLFDEFREAHPDWVASWEAAHRAGSDRAQLRHTLQGAFGGRLHSICSSGAPTPPALLKMFSSVGVPIYEFYGTTETGIVTAGSGEGVPAITGPLVPGVELRVEADGEIFVRGPGVSLGYFRDERATAELIDRDGWCVTGDLGVLRSDGNLQITGRKKDIFNTSEGSNMYPSRVEALLEDEPLIAQAVLIGDRRPFISALVFPESSKLSSALGRPVVDADYVTGGALHSLIIDRVQLLNETLEPYERVAKVTLVREAFPDTVRSIVGGIGKTRVRRDLVEQTYQAEINAIYQQPITE